MLQPCAVNNFKIEQVVVALMFFAQMWKVLDSNTGYPNRDPSRFSSGQLGKCRDISCSSSDRFLPKPFQFSNDPPTGRHTVWMLPAPSM
jgi:hypothetical protein